MWMARTLEGRVANPVHFWPDPDPANQNFKNRIRIPDPTGTYQNSIETSIFFSSHQSDFFWYLNDEYFYMKKIEKLTWKCVKALFLKYIFLVYTTLHSQSTDRIRIRIRSPWTFSGSDQKDPDAQPWCGTVRYLLGSFSHGAKWWAQKCDQIGEPRPYIEPGYLRYWSISRPV